MTGTQPNGFRYGAEARHRGSRCALIALYADNSQLRTIDQDNPPSNPRVLQGKQAVGEHDFFWPIKRLGAGQHRPACARPSYRATGAACFSCF
jgi:hypothetical protein